MAYTESIVTEIAIPLTGWVITRKEAQSAYGLLLSVQDRDFARVCGELAHHGFGTDAKTNKMKILLTLLYSSEVDRVIQRMLDVSVPPVLKSISTGTTSPYAIFVIMLHGRLRYMGLGKRGALRALDQAIPEGHFNRSIHRLYEEKFGTDNATGWDKAMHFTKAAWIAYTSPEAAVIASYGKEAWDQAEHWVGKDPEGWSNADIDADMLGIGWGMVLQTSP